MAKYGINAEGISALTQLASDMSSLNNDIEESGRALKSTISSIGDDLGIYETEIIELVSKVNNVQEKGSDSVELLVKKVKDLILVIQSLINVGL